MKKFFFVIYFIFISQFGFSQKHFIFNSDSLNLSRVACLSTGIAGSWAIGTIAFTNLWYKDFPKSNFHLFNDSHEWLQMDKMGHFFTTNKLSLITTDLFKWSGMNKNNSILLGCSIGLGLQTTIEILDGYNSQWGFSISDMAANTLGVFSFASQSLFWNDQRIILKFSDHQTQYAALNPLVLGKSFAERFLKDYNGQSYWLSFNPSSFSKYSNLPKWLCFSIGYSIDQKISGSNEIFHSSITNLTYFSQRKFLLSLDIDFSKLSIKNEWLKLIVKQFNFIKIPFPTLIYMDGKLSASGFYF